MNTTEPYLTCCTSHVPPHTAILAPPDAQPCEELTQIVQNALNKQFALNLDDTLKVRIDGVWLRFRCLLPGTDTTPPILCLVSRDATPAPTDAKPRFVIEMF